MAVLNYLINDPQANILLQAERGVPANSALAVEIAEELNKLDATYGTAANYLAIVAENSSPIFPPLPNYAGTANDDVIKYLSDEMLAPTPGMTPEEAGAYFVDTVNDLAANY